MGAFEFDVFLRDCDMWEELVTMWGELRRSGDSLSLSECSLQSQWLLLRYVLAGVASVTYHCSESSESKFETIYLWRGGKDGGRGQGDCPGIFWCVCVVFFVCVWCFLCVDVCVPGCSMFLMNGR